MCAAVADPVSLAKVSFHLSVVPLRVALNNPCAAGRLTTCFGTSCPDDRAAVQTVFWVAASESAARARVQTAPAAISVTSFFTGSSLWALPAPRSGISIQVFVQTTSPVWGTPETSPDEGSGEHRPVATPEGNRPPA